MKLLKTGVVTNCTYSAGLQRPVLYIPNIPNVACMSGWRHLSAGDSADGLLSTLSATSRRVSRCRQLITRPKWSAINCADTGRGITDYWPRTCRILNTTFMTFSRQLARGDSGALLPLLSVCEINHPISTWNFVPNAHVAQMTRHYFIW